MKTRNIFLILVSIWLIDFVLTIIGVHFNGFYETNPITRFFFDKGIPGILSFFFLTPIFIFIQSFLIHKVSYNKYNLKPNFTLITGLSVFCLVEFYAIINNLYWLLWKNN